MSGGDAEEARAELRKPLIQTGSWYRLVNPNAAAASTTSSTVNVMGRRQSSIFSSMVNIKDSAISIVFCVLIVALGPIQ